MNKENLSELAHVCINVENIERAVNWYLSSFSCKLIAQDKIQAELEFKNIRLHLSLPSNSQMHLAFIRQDADTLGELKERFGGVRSTFISDSSGNIVEIIQA